MKKLLASFLSILALVFLAVPSVHAQNNVNLYLFWGDGCPHCAEEKAYLSQILPNYSNAKLNKFEIYFNQDNVRLMQEVSTKMDANASGVPFLIIGDQTFIGFSKGNTDNEIKNRIEYCTNNVCPDSVASIVKGEEVSENKDQKTSPDSSESKNMVNIPIIGKVNAASYSIPIITIVLGTIDGFNPCAMWTLLFLISLLLRFKDRKKMWLLGGVFIFASAFCYFLFMAAWLNLILFIGFVFWVRLSIGAVALIGGSYSVKKGIANKDGGCEVTGTEKRQATFNRLRGIVNKNNLVIAILGIAALAFAVNLVELICSAGLPAIFTQVLALNHLATWQYLGYIVLYIFFFMLDDIIIFVIAMTTLKMTGISTKYSRYSGIIGGILMIIIGLLLIFKPQLLMFG